MWFFDRFVKKNDVRNYLKLRRIFLKQAMVEEIEKADLENRESIRTRFESSIYELEYMFIQIKNNTLKNESKWYFKYIYKEDP